LIQASSFLAYFPYLWKSRPLPMSWLAVSMTIALAAILREVFLAPPEPTPVTGSTAQRKEAVS
jgi:hypothetical protein